jgi:hypothetical protein
MELLERVSRKRSTLKQLKQREGRRKGQWRTITRKAILQTPREIADRPMVQKEGRRL